MTTKTKILLAIAITGVAGTAFWLWFRQKDAVPASAIPIMQQARAVLATSPTAGGIAGDPGTPPAGVDDISLLSQIASV